MTKSDISQEAQKTNAIYDAAAATYGYDIASTGPARLKYEILRQQIRSTDRVLDVGCGNGIHMHVIASLCAQVDGIDISDGMLEQARTKIAEAGLTNAAVHRASAESLPFEAASFDLVYSFSTLLLVPRFDDALAEVARVLKPGGRAILDITGHWNLSRWHWGRYYRSQGHFGVHSFTWPQVCTVFARHGLTIIDHHALGLTDQWKYLPFVHRFKAIDRLFHDGSTWDRDYRLSNRPLLRRFANRWYTLARKD